MARDSPGREDIVLRGCKQEPPARLLESMRTHHEAPHIYPVEWGLSVAAMLGASEDQILRHAPQLRQSHYRVAPVSYFHEHEFHVVLDHGSHGLITSWSEPTIDDAATIAAGFGPARMNRFYKERRRHRVGR